MKNAGNKLELYSFMRCLCYICWTPLRRFESFRVQRRLTMREMIQLSNQRRSTPLFHLVDILSYGSMHKFYNKNTYIGQNRLVCVCVVSLTGYRL